MAEQNTRYEAQTRENTPSSLEDSFRESLKDLVTIAEVLGQHCENSIPRLISLAQFGIENDDQLHILMHLVKSASIPKGGKR